MRDGLLLHLALMLTRRIPMFLFALAAIIIAAVRWKRHPRVSLMTIIAFVIYLIDAFVFSVFTFYMPYLFRPFSLTSKSIDWLYFFIYFFADFVQVIIIVLLTSAAFAQRGSPPVESKA